MYPPLLPLRGGLPVIQNTKTACVDVVFTIENKFSSSSKTYLVGVPLDLEMHVQIMTIKLTAESAGLSGLGVHLWET